MSGLLEIVIGNRNYSSWSLRGWLAIKQTGLLFPEIFIPLRLPYLKPQIAANSKSGLVPVLKVDGFEVWDSLAIIETLNDLAPDAGLWPEDFDARARARVAVPGLAVAVVRVGHPVDRQPDALAADPEQVLDRLPRRQPPVRVDALHVGAAGTIGDPPPRYRPSPASVPLGSCPRRVDFPTPVPAKIPIL